MPTTPRHLKVKKSEKPQDKQQQLLPISPSAIRACFQFQSNDDGDADEAAFAILDDGGDDAGKTRNGADMPGLSRNTGLSVFR